MRGLEGHNINMKNLNDKMKISRINKPEKLEGLDQQKPEGLAGQNATNNTSKHEHDSSEHAKNKRRRTRQKENKSHKFIQNGQEGRGSDTDPRQTTAPSPAAKRKSAG